MPDVTEPVTYYPILGRGDPGYGGVKSVQWQALTVLNNTVGNAPIAQLAARRVNGVCWLDLNFTIGATTSPLSFASSGFYTFVLPQLVSALNATALGSALFSLPAIVTNGVNTFVGAAQLSVSPANSYLTNIAQIVVQTPSGLWQVGSPTNAPASGTWFAGDGIVVSGALPALGT